MAQGMQVFKSNGDLLIDTSTLVGQFINSFKTDQATGSITNPLLSTGTPFAFAITGKAFAGGDIPITPDLAVISPATCKVTVVGDTLSWDWSTGDDRKLSTEIVIQYGVF